MDKLAIAAAVREDAGVKEFNALPPFLPMELQSFMARSAPAHGLLIAPDGYDDIGLAIMAHEAGHVATSPHTKDGLSDADVVDYEFLATKWGFQSIRRHGGRVTKAMQDSAREALASYTDKLGLGTNPAVARFISGGKL